MTSRPGSERVGADRPVNEQDGDATSGSPVASGPASTGNAPTGNADVGAVDRIVERFGGIRPMANKLDIPVTTVQGWRKRGAIPLARHADLRVAATKHAIALDDADLDAATPTEERGAADSAPVTETTVAEAPTTTPESPQTEATLNAAAPDDAAKPDAPATESITASITAPVAESVAAPAASVEPPPSLPAPDYLDEPRSASGFASALSIVALLVGAAALAEPWWGPQLSGWPNGASVPAASVSGASAPAADPALRAQVQQLADRVGRLEQRPASAAPAGDSAALDAAISQLTQRLDSLEKRPAATGGANTAGADAAGAAALADRLGGLEQRLTTLGGGAKAAQDLGKEVEALKQQIASVGQTVETRRDSGMAAQALVLAAGQLRATLAAGQPFQQDLQSVRALGIGDAGVTQPLDAVAPFAAKGIPTQAQITDRFRPLASDIVRAAERGDGANWIDSVIGKLSTLVTVRRQGGGVVGSSADAIVARAEAALGENNLGKAVEELAALQGAGAGAAAAWLADAKARLAADQAARALTQRAIALLTAASGGKGAAQ
ncbi:hypothetical protein D3877_00520 [Azospirillum cavernae]|uniref:Inner membrane protein n=1 Tax=Azospirillum cavernae TaxID=2320860 RepID=A0A418VZP0_9PROT|nr:mitofilin family membrane protein [Azospirillum cavernae]RJF83223.1 hypothetical protein D3877_00520 [Azospirillum cavernae]